MKNRFERYYQKLATLVYQVPTIQLFLNYPDFYPGDA